MPRRPRCDSPGCLHHVVNRGHRRGPLFELRSDFRDFEMRLACVVRRGLIRIHAFCLLTNHYHILIESVDGRLSEALRWIQSGHALHFNRSRECDGSLYRGRFLSIPVVNVAHLFQLIRYIDFNPKHARLGDLLTYDYGSAVLHATNQRPAWLACDLIDRMLEPGLRQGAERVAVYRQTFRLGSDACDPGPIIEARLAHVSRARDDLDELLTANGAARRAWLLRRAKESDGRPPGLPMASAVSIQGAVDQHRRCTPVASIDGRTGSTLLWDAVEVGLLRDLGGLRYADLERLLGASKSTMCRRYAAHLRAMHRDPAYAMLASEVARRALELSFGPAIAVLSDEILRERVSRGRSKNA